LVFVCVKRQKEREEQTKQNKAKQLYKIIYPKNVMQAI